MNIREWLDEDKLGIDIWTKKYKWKDEDFEGWLNRISDGDIELRKAIKKKEFLFAGRTLANYNTGNKNTTSNCFVMGFVPDSILGMMEMLKEMAITYKSGGGCGINLSKIRPKGSEVIGQNGYKSDGFSGFLELFNQLTKTISQGARRGALMAMMSVEHPDIIDFIDVKKVGDTSVTSANLSVIVTDEFMEYVFKGVGYKKDFIVEDTGEVIEHFVDAPMIYKKIMENAHSSAEPGILFWDNMLNSHLLGGYDEYKIVGNNPCSEFFGDKDSACNLGSINLSAFVKDGEFDFDRFSVVVKIGVRALNNVIDYGTKRLPTEGQQKNVITKRNLGLGIMGLADMFIKCRITYGSVTSKVLSQKIAKLMFVKALEESIELAKENGCCEFLDNISARIRVKERVAKKIGSEMYSQDILDYGLRNISLLSIAPTGSIATMLGLSGGIEPVFRNYYERTTKTLHGEDFKYKVFHKSVKELVIDEAIPDYCIESDDINWKDRIEMQSAWQDYVDLSISSTINLPKETTLEDVMDIYKEAWKKNLNGITIYRDGSLEGILNDITEEDKVIEREITYHKKEIKIGCGVIRLMIGYDGENIIDFYTIAVGNGGCYSNLNSLAISMSKFLKLGGDLDNLAESFSGSQPCTSFTSSRAKGNDLAKGKNCATAIVNSLKSFIKENENENTKKERDYVDVKRKEKNNNSDFDVRIRDNKFTCPECGDVLNPIGGCYSCNCGYSKCD